MAKNKHPKREIANRMGGFNSSAWQNRKNAIANRVIDRVDRATKRRLARSGVDLKSRV